jgi:hypothetical protein
MTLMLIFNGENSTNLSLAEDVVPFRSEMHSPDWVFRRYVAWPRSPYRAIYRTHHTVRNRID